MFTKFLTGFLLSIALLAGCSYPSSYTIGRHRGDALVRSVDVEIIENVSGHRYRVAGRVHAHIWRPKWLPRLKLPQDVLVTMLKREAALLGAGAVIDVKRYSRSQFEWDEEHLMGTAVILCVEGENGAL